MSEFCARFAETPGTPEQDHSELNFARTDSDETAKEEKLPLLPVAMPLQSGQRVSALPESECSSSVFNVIASPFQILFISVILLQGQLTYFWCFEKFLFSSYKLSYFRSCMSRGLKKEQIDCY